MTRDEMKYWICGQCTTLWSECLGEECYEHLSDEDLVDLINEWKERFAEEEMEAANE